jgi:hypothetical protein
MRLVSGESHDSHEARMQRLADWQEEYFQEQATLDLDLRLWEAQMADPLADPDLYRCNQGRVV